MDARELNERLKALLGDNVKKLDQVYWNERSVILNESLLNIGDEFYGKLSGEYDRAISRIQKEIESFYGRYASDNKVSFSDAKKLLTSPERKNLMMDINDYIDKAKSLRYSPEWSLQVENASTAHRVTRLQSLQLQMYQQVEELHSKYNTGLTDTAQKVFTEGYYRNIYEVQKAYGQGAAFAKLDTEKIKTIINTPWAPDGSNFSVKIWEDRTELVNYLKTELTQAFIRGESADRLIIEIKKKFGVSSKNAARLVQTETAFFSAMSKLESYKAMGYKKYIIVAVMDAKTSDICRAMDGEVFDIEDFHPGATANPFHPRCRSTTAPYAGTTDKDKAAPGMLSNPQNGKMYAIPQGMTYKDWTETYVDSEDLTIGSGEINHDEDDNSGNENKPVFVEKINLDEVDKKLVEYENIIKDNDYETAYAIMENGDVYMSKGGRDYVSLKGIQLKNSIITHNHPVNEWGDSDSFGKNDFETLKSNPDIKELRAVNYLYRYKLRLLKPIDISYNDIYIQGLQKAIDAGEDEQNQHYIMEYLKELGYIDYRREKIEP